MKNSEYRLKRLAAKQAGLTLLEVIISLSIIASATVGLNMIADRFSDDTKNTVTASQVRTFGEAAKAYIKDNYAAVQGVATAATPALIDVPTLIAAGNLTTGFLATNAFGQSMCALVLEPTANRLQAMVVAEGGTVIDDLSMGNIASVIGGSGGAVYASDATVIRGAIGGWSIPTSTFDNLVNNVSKKCDGTAGNVRLVAGHPAMALWFENGDTSSAFLARDAVPGRPELNAMNTPLVMNSVQTSDAVCSSLGAIARNATGAVLSCDGGKWKTQGSAFWQDPVANYTALPACAAAISGQTRVVSTPTAGSGPRAYTCNGAAWTALAVDDSGNLALPGTATTGKIQLSDVVTEGAACGANGLVARDSTGLLLSCQSGVWKTGTVKDYLEFDYGGLGSCSIPDTCRYFIDTFSITSERIVLSVGSHQAANPYGSSWVQINLDGVICSISRSIDSTGYHPYSSATCMRRLAPGTHTIITYFVGDAAASVSAEGTKGSRAIF